MLSRGTARMHGQRPRGWCVTQRRHQGGGPLARSVTMPHVRRSRRHGVRGSVQLPRTHGSARALHGTVVPRPRHVGSRRSGPYSSLSSSRLSEGQPSCMASAQGRWCVITEEEALWRETSLCTSRLEAGSGHCARASVGKRSVGVSNSSPQHCHTPGGHTAPWSVGVSNYPAHLTGHWVS